MKKIFKTLLFVTLLVSILCLSACGMENGGSLKSITRPYINEYECTEARIGDEDFLKKFEYIKVTLVDDEQLVVSYKPKDGEKRDFTCNYEMNAETRELIAEKGFFGVKTCEKVKIENGQFEIVRKIGEKTLYMKFQTK